MSRSSIITLAIIGLIIILVAAYTWSVRHVSQKERLATSVASSALTAEEGELGYTTLTGESVDLSSELGNVMVVTSWASWCPACVTELPALSGLATENSDVRFLAINRAEPQTTAEQFLLTVNATNGIELVLDPNDHYYESIAGYAMPETIVYDENGDIVRHFRGTLNREELQRTLDELLNENE